MLLIKPLSQTFFDKLKQQNLQWKQVLNYQQEDPKELRGYAVITVNINDYIFAVPLHSKCRDKHFLLERIHTVENNKYVINNRGIDYQKALVIEETYLLERPFIIPDNEFILIQENEQKIITDFTEYVEKYKTDFMSLKKQNFERKYKFSTLQYYHKELGLE